MSAIESVRDDFVQLWARLGPFWGIPPTTARIFAFLLARTEPADGDTIAEGLQMSRGAASMACRELLDWGLIHAERTPGSRRVCYRCEGNLEKAIRAIIQTRKRREWDPILDNVHQWQASLRGLRGKEATHLRGRLSDIEGVIGLVDSMAEAFLKGGIVPKLGLKAMVAAANRHRKGSKRKVRR